MSILQLAGHFGRAITVQATSSNLISMSRWMWFDLTVAVPGLAGLDLG